MSVISRYFGVFLGYLPHTGRIEFMTYSNGVVMCLELTEELQKIVSVDYRYFYHLLGTGCCFYIDLEMKCHRIKSSDHFKFD